MIEKHLKFSSFADIAIDYTADPPKIRFYNVEKCFTWKRRIFFSCLLAATFISAYIYSVTQQMGSIAALLIAFSVIYFLAESIPVMLSYGPINKCYLKLMTGKARHQTVISNPTGNISCRTSHFLIDIIYDDAIKKALKNLTFRKISWFGWELKIKIVGAPKGKLIIKEY